MARVVDSCRGIGLAAAVGFSPLPCSHSERSALQSTGWVGLSLRWVCLQVAAHGADLLQEAARAGMSGEEVQSLFCFILASPGVRHFCNVPLV